MGLKHCIFCDPPCSQFDSSVILYGTETGVEREEIAVMFDSSVILYGTETTFTIGEIQRMFDSSVILYGTETLVAAFKDHRKRLIVV